MTKTQTKKKNTLSKSKLMRGLQCEKLLWLSINRPELSEETSASAQMQFDEGNEVGELARKLEGSGDLIDNEYWDFKGAAERTQELIKNGSKLIYEAAFLKDDLYFRADILKKTRSGWHLIEVKKATQVKEEYIQDCAIQTIVIESSGITLTSIFLRHINNEMVYPAFADFFKTEDITEEVRAEIPKIKKAIASLKKIAVDEKEPKRTIGLHCDSPHECPYKSTCWKNVPDFSVFDLPSLNSQKKWEHYTSKLIKISDLDPNDYKEVTKRAIEATQNKKTFIDKKGIKDELKEWKWPLYFFDFETINPAIPKYKGTSPYLQIPFQYSCHVWKDEKNDLEHFEFLHTENSDPRKAIVAAMLKHLGKKGSIVSYNQAFEKGVIKKLAEFDKANKDALLALLDRFVDPLPIFQKFVYHPEFRGSFSIKAVAPALIGEKLNYENLDIGDGGTAQSMASLLMFNVVKEDSERKKIIADLLEYCHQDTLAMVEIVKWLMKV